MARRGTTQNRKTEVVVVAGIRTPMGKMGGAFDKLGAVELGAIALREVLARSPVRSDDIDQVIIGNVIQPSDAGITVTVY
ncbi:hypothetical protein [Mariprofundus sp. NF]|uniref:thiolase family protein n=1 Tax=Mariprofundus sp. NF TaxID=2608716 RepID=UPI001F50DF2E|nr:hypothetical protein [Mariprofundus sp. NF]